MKKAQDNGPKLANTNNLAQEKFFEGVFEHWIKNFELFETGSAQKKQQLKELLLESLQINHPPGTNQITEFDFSLILESVNSYLRTIVKHFNTEGYLSSDVLDSYLNKIEENAIFQNKYLSIIAKTFVENIFQRINCFVRKQNQYILTHEINLVFETKAIVLKTYSDELTRYRREKGPFSHSLFLKMCQSLFERCMEAFTESTEYKCKLIKENRNFIHELDTLAKQLMEIAKRQAHENQIEGKQRKTNLVSDQICKETSSQHFTESQTPSLATENPIEASWSSNFAGHKDELVKAKLEQIAQHYQNVYQENFLEAINLASFHMKDLKVRHSQIVLQIKPQFEKDIAEKIGDEIDGKKMWRTYMEADIQKIYNEIKEDGKQEDTKPKSIPIDNKIKSKLDGNFLNFDLRTSKLPLVLQITQEKVGMALGLPQEPAVIKYKMNETWTPNIIGQTFDGRILYGNEVNCDAAENNTRVRWNIGKIIETRKSKPLELIIGNMTMSVRIELLLGLLLKKLKTEAEEKVPFQKFKECVLCIPFFYTSMQRQQILDSARIAGFGIIRLVNDISILASEYAHVRMNKPNGPFLVATQASKNITDVALFKYEYELHKQKVCTGQHIRMVSHVGSYQEDGSSTAEIDFSRIRRILQTSDKNDEIVKQAKTFYKLIQLTILKYHDEVLHPNCLTKFDCLEKLLLDALKDSAVVCLSTYSNAFSEIILALCGEKINLEQNETILTGACRLSPKKGKTYSHSVSDLLSSALWQQDGEDQKLVLDNGLVIDQQVNIHTISQSKSSVFRQNLFSTTAFDVTNLRLNLSGTQLLQNGQALRINFCVKNDGIFRMTSVDLLDSDQKRKIKTLTRGKYYETSSSCLQKNDLEDYQRYVNNVFHKRL